MNIQEMHLSVMQGVDKINAQVADTLLVGEIDRELNKAIQQYVSTRFQKNNKHQQGFEESQKRRDDLRTLIREIATNVSFKEEIRGINHASGALYADSWVIPEDYMHLININSVVMRNDDCSRISYQLMDQDPVPFWPLSLTEFFVSEGTYIDELWLVMDIEQDWASDQWNGELIWTVPDDFQGVQYTQENSQSFIENWGSGLQMPLPIYWEQWNPNIAANAEGFDLANAPWFGNPESLYYPNSWILTVNFSTFPQWVDDNGDPIFNADASIGPITYAVARLNNGSVKYIPMQMQEDLGHRRVPTTNTFLREVYPCRLVQHDDIFKLVDDPFNKAKYSSPLTVMRDHHVDIYSDDTYIVDQIRLTYLSRPVLVSLPDDVNCNLPIHTHEEICKIAVLNILEEISDPRYKTQLSQVDRME